MEHLIVPVGPDSTWQVPVGDGVTNYFAPHNELVDLAGAIDGAFSAPIDFPPLDQALVPGDQLALAVDARLPRLNQLLAAMLEWFIERGTPETHIRLVLAGGGPGRAAAVAEALQRRTGLQVAVEDHDCDDPQGLAYVAANEQSDPIYLNRGLVDADVILPVSCAQPLSGVDYFGAFGIFPLLSDRATRSAFYSLPKLEEPTEHARLQAWADQAAWWVGALAAIEVIPAGGDQVAAVKAGQLQPLETASQQSMNELWNCTEPATSELVVAIMDSPPQAQSWLGLARVLYAAQRFVAPRGAIVLATQLRQPIGKALSRLRDPHLSPEVVARKLATDQHDDALAASVILRTISSHHVYLISDLASEVVESLGMGAITQPEQLARLINQHGSCTIIESAQHRGVALCPQ